MTKEQQYKLLEICKKLSRCLWDEVSSYDEGELKMQPTVQRHKQTAIEADNLIEQITKHRGQK